MNTGNDTLSGSKINFELHKDIAKEADQMLKCTIDTIIILLIKYLPVLDLQVNIPLKENQRLNFKFY